MINPDAADPQTPAQSSETPAPRPVSIDMRPDGSIQITCGDCKSAEVGLKVVELMIKAFRQTARSMGLKPLNYRITSMHFEEKAATAEAIPVADAAPEEDART
ncbi:MAG TPA: hypothetical protein VGS58_21535 [Candidatus Sulfopaludibacter sp.]|nr:hypothetical protein [Candidatus Sulfopaludibacter sp.]